MIIEDELEEIMARTNDFTEVTTRVHKFKLDLAKRLEDVKSAYDDRNLPSHYFYEWEEKLDILLAELRE